MNYEPAGIIIYHYLTFSVRRVNIRSSVQHERYRSLKLLTKIPPKKSTKAAKAGSSAGSKKNKMGLVFSSPPAATRESIAAITGKHPIVMFISQSCPYCHEAKSVLESAGHTPHVVVATGPQRTILREMTLSGSVPNVWIKGKFVGGCNDGPESWMGVTKMLKNGKLSELLSSGK